jgi:hypothetical protein
MNADHQAVVQFSAAATDAQRKPGDYVKRQKKRNYR